tara:strand:+ start:159 stop:479 length:321 start_codon:yes stop_codon:yes gene_type:complete
MTCDIESSGNVVRLPRWFVITILSGAVSFAGFAISVITNEAKEEAQIVDHDRTITLNESKIDSNSQTISEIKTDIAVIRVQQSANDKALERIEVKQSAILDALKKD